MKITKRQLRRIIKEALEVGSFDRAAGAVFNLVDKLKHEERQGRPVTLGKDGEIPILGELSDVLQWLNEHREEMNPGPAPPRTGLR